MVEDKDLRAIIRILRRVTIVVKIYPFLYSMLFVSCMLSYMFCSDKTSILCDQLFYTSPFAILCAICLSYSLKLCKWHRLECILPLLPSIAVLVDEYIYQIPKSASYINCAIMISICIMSLVNAYFVFIKHNTK